jgi:hypothetical protein
MLVIINDYQFQNELKYIKINKIEYINDILFLMQS